MHIRKIKSNAKGEFEYGLGPCTLIVGKNRSGKTRIIDAIALALRGEAYTEGLGKQEVRLMALKPDGAKGLYAELELTDGQKIGWAADGTTAKAKRATWASSDPALPLPIGALIADEARALLAADPKKLRPALLAQLPVEIAVDALKKRVPPALWPRMEELLGGLSDSYSASDLMSALASVNEQLLGTRRELRKIKTVLDAGVVALTDEEENELAALVRLSSAQTMPTSQVEELKSYAEKLRGELAETEEEMGRLGRPAGVDSLQAKLVHDVVAAQVCLIDYLKARGGAAFDCPLCGTAEITLAAVEARLEAFNKARAQLAEQNRGAARRAELERRYDGLKRQLAETTAQIKAAKPGEPVDHDRLRTLQEAKARAEHSAALGERQSALKKTETDLKALRKTTQEVVGETLDQETDALVERINLGLPENLDVSIKLRDGDREVCRVELGGRDLRALCGAERAALVVAFSSACVRDEHPPVRLLVVDDVWLDREMVPEVLEGVHTVVQMPDVGPTQAIVSLVEYDGPDPAGWTVIRL